MAHRTPLSSSELGTLWLTYQEKSLIIAVLKCFINKSDDQHAKKIMSDLLENLNAMQSRVTKILENDGAAIPVGFTDQDINHDAPRLFDKGLDIMIIRILKEISMGLYTLHVNMSYREDVFQIYKELTSITQKCYFECTKHLLEKGLLSRPANVSMPKTVKYVQSNFYLAGLNPFSQKRPLNTIEVGYLHHGIESNNVGLQLITGFAQCAQTEEARKYFKKGMVLSKKIIKEFETILIEDNIPMSNSSGGIVTRSKVAPFSDRLMMNFIFFLNSFGMGCHSFGAAFSFRYDLILKFVMFGKDVYFYEDDGIKIMIKNGWLEKPPGMANREALTRGN